MEGEGKISGNHQIGQGEEPGIFKLWQWWLVSGLVTIPKEAKEGSSKPLQCQRCGKVVSVGSVALCW